MYGEQLRIVTIVLFLRFYVNGSLFECDCSTITEVRIEHFINVTFQNLKKTF